ncbi:MAG: DUF3313 family protein [Gammaproteobacteria bacterium]
MAGLRISMLILLGGLLAAGCAAPPGTGFKPQWDGLVLRPGTRLDAVYVQPGAEVHSYDNIILDPVEVSFASNWDPNRGTVGASDRLDAQDIQRIRRDMAALFREVFAEELAEGGYRLVDEPAYDTLRVTPAIVDLYINAPERNATGRSRVYTAEAGSMTLVLELRDSVTGDILARVIDSSTARQTGMYTMTSQTSNTAEARRAFRNWAGILREGLDEARARAR